MARSLVVLTVLCLILCQTAYCGTNHTVKMALHVKTHFSKQHCGNLPPLDHCSDIVHTLGTCDPDVDVFVVVFDYVGTLKGAEFGLTWPAGWGSAVTTYCADGATGTIVNPGDGMSISWNSCTSGPDYWPVAWARLLPTGAGRIDLIPNPATSFIGIRDCNSVQFAPVAVYGAGVCGSWGDEPCRTRTWYVDPYGTGDVATIQTALDVAAAGDTVLVAAGTYTGEGNRDLVIQDKDLVLRSESGPDSTILDGEGTYGYTLIGVVSRNPATIVDGFTLTGGYDFALPPAMACYEGSPRISNCIFVDNHDRMIGGAISCEATGAEFTDCVFRSNCAYERQVIITFGAPKFRRCVFDGDGEPGGAVTCLYDSHPTFSDCQFYNHSANIRGVLNFYADASLTADSCTFWGNYCGSSGHIMRFNDAVDPVVTNCTLWGNSTPGRAAIVIEEGSQVSISNTIIASTLAGQAVYVEDSTCVPTLTCCDIYGNPEGDWTGYIAGQLGINGNISEDPAFCAPESADFHVHDTSPCVTDPICGQIGAWGIGCQDAGVPWDDRDGTDSPRTFGLLANRPNPFRPKTQVVFSLPDAGDVEVAVYDAAGRRVRVLADGPFEAGVHQVSWDGTGDSGRALTPGVYFCRLTSGGRVAARKIVLVR